MTETQTKRPRRSRKPAEHPKVDDTGMDEEIVASLEEQDANADQDAAAAASEPDEAISYPIQEVRGYQPSMPTGASGTYAVASMTDQAFDEQLSMMKRGRDRIAQIQRELMVRDEDYGLIPGTPKPTLFKPGAEKLALMYGLAAEVKHELISGDGDTAPAIQYHASTFLHLGNFNGPIVAVGHGTANSWEKRYRRDSAKKCPNCEKTDTVITSKKEYGGGWYCFPKKGGCGSKFTPDDERMTSQATDAKGDSVGSYDLGNTLLKMAEKRSFVDGVLRATASSSLFTQDVVDEPVVDNSDEPSGGARRTVDTSGGDYMDTSEVEPETEVRPAELGEVERGGHRPKVTGAQIQAARELARSLKLTPWQVADEIAEVFQGGLDSTQLDDDKAAAGKQLVEFMEGMDPDDMGKLITHLRAKQAAQ